MGLFGMQSLEKLMRSNFTKFHGHYNDTQRKKNWLNNINIVQKYLKNPLYCDVEIS